EIERLENLGGFEVNEAKKILANEATALLHGKPAAEQAAETARRTFEEGASAAGLPTITYDPNVGIGLLSANVQLGFASTNSEARRQMRAGAIRVNDTVVKDESFVIINSNADGDKVSLGKKKHGLVKPQ
ncbi:MAG: tyrosine--tRNA ligase, partial [Rhizobiales bacterium]|nr:tyrosine--tRNA ligase [Hyphomicrobiales bacterium]